MDYGAALSAIEASGHADASAIVAAIKGQVAQVLNEKRTAQGTASAVGTSAEAILTALGAAGDDLPSRFADAVGKFQALQTSSATATASVKSLSEANQSLLTQVATLGRKATMAQIVAASGATEAVLEVLIPDHSKVTIADGKVAIDGTAWDDWIKAPTVAPFVPALLPNGAATVPAAGSGAAGAAGQSGATGTTLPKLPTNAAGGQQPTTSLYDRVRGLSAGGVVPSAPAQAQTPATRPISPYLR